MKQCKSGEVPLLIHWGNGPYITPHHHHNPPTHIYIKTSPKLMLNLNIMWNMISKQCIAMDYLWRTTTIIIHKPTLLQTWKRPLNIHQSKMTSSKISSNLDKNIHNITFCRALLVWDASENISTLPTVNAKERDPIIATNVPDHKVRSILTLGERMFARWRDPPGRARAFQDQPPKPP